MFLPRLFQAPFDKFSSLFFSAENIGRLFRTRFKGSQFIVVSLKDGRKFCSSILPHLYRGHVVSYCLLPCSLVVFSNANGMSPFRLSSLAPADHHFLHPSSIPCQIPRWNFDSRAKCSKNNRRDRKWEREYRRWEWETEQR